MAIAIDRGALAALRLPVNRIEALHGRREQMDALANAFAAPQGGLTLVLGGPRCGKTSLLLTVQELLWRRLQGENAPDPWRRTPPVLPLRVETEGQNSAEELLAELMLAFRAQARERLGVCQVDDDQLRWQTQGYVQTRKPSFLDSAFRMVYEVVEAAHRGLRVVWFLDDAERLLALPWGGQFLGLVNGLLKPYASFSRAKELSVVMAGGGALYRAFAQGGLWTGEVGEVLLTPWNDAALLRGLDAQIAAIAPALDPLPDALVAKLSAETGGHPGLLCGEVLPALLPLAEGEADANGLAARLDGLSEGLLAGEFWAEWFAALGETERLLYWALLGKAEGQSVRELRAGQPQLAQDPLGFQQALKVLGFSGLVRSEGALYRPGPGLWNRWFQANAPRPQAAADATPEFEMRVRLGSQGGYQVEVTAEAGRLREGPELYFPWDEAELNDILGRFNRMAEGAEAADEALLTSVGSSLYETFLTGTARRLFDQTWGLGAGEKQIVFRLSIDDPLLAGLPWELLLRSDDGVAGEYLSLSNRRPFVRDVALPEPAPPPRFETPIHILAVLSNPVNDLDLAGEESRLRAALAEPLADGRVTLAVLPTPTPVTLNRAILRQEPQILHYAGHGAYDDATGEGYLLIERDGAPFQLTGTALAELVEGSSVQLVVLDACETGYGGRAHPGLGVAPVLIRQARLPAVVAMQYPILDRAALIFCEEFYTALLAPDVTIEGALARARVRLAQEMGRGHIAWATPALWMRARSGRVAG